MDNVTIKIAERKDLDAAAELVQSWTRHMDYNCGKEEILANLKRTYMAGVVVLAKDKDDKLIGLMSGLKTYHFWIHEWIAHDDWFFVAPECRGKGVAFLLDRAFGAWAKAMSCGSVIMSPNKFGSMDVEHAAARMKKYGYEPHGVLLRRTV